MAQVYAAKYLAKAALSAPRDLINAYVATVRPIHPTVLIFHCTWVCDAQCEMCHNWKRADRKHEMSLADIDRVFSSGLWKNIETANVSGGEPTTRNDLVELCEVMLNRLPRLRKFGINTTGLTPHRAIPMLTKIVELCNKKGVIFSTRVSIDGVGDMHNDVRHVKNGFNKANETIRAMRELQKTCNFNFGISTTIFSQNLDDAENILSWARKEKLDIVFNMVRFTDAMLGNGDLSDTCKPLGPEGRADAPVLSRSRPHRSAAGRAELHLPALRRHDREWISPAQPVPVPDAGHHAEPRRRHVLLREQRGRRATC